MTFEQRLAEIRDRLCEAKLDRVVALHDGAHFIEKPDPVNGADRIQGARPGRGLLDRGGAVSLVVTPAWDAERARECCPGHRNRCGR